MINLKSYFLLVCLFFALLFNQSCNKSDGTTAPEPSPLKLNKSAITFPATAFTDTIRVLSPSGWKIISQPNWVTVSRTEGLGAMDILVTVERNESATEKVGSISFEYGESQTLSVSVKQVQFDIVLNQPEYSGSGGNICLIDGAGFSSVLAENKVFIGGTEMHVSEIFPNAIVVDIPVGQPSGELIVKVNGKSSAPAKFRYQWRGRVTVIAGGNGDGYLDGNASIAKFYRPSGIAVDAAGNIYVCDNGNEKVRKISTNGIVSTLPGRLPESAEPGAPITKYDAARDAVVDAFGNVYISEYVGNHITKIDPNGVVSIYAGTSEIGKADGPAADATFQRPSGMHLDNEGNIYVADVVNHRIRKISAGGQVTTLAGNYPGFKDGTGAEAIFNYPSGIAALPNGDLVVTDYLNHRIRKLTPTGVCTTLAGKATSGRNDGTLSTATFNSPSAVAADQQGNIFIGEQNNGIRWINPQGEVNTILLEYESLENPGGMVVNANGELIVADFWGSRIIKVTYY